MVYTGTVALPYHCFEGKSPHAPAGRPNTDLRRKLNAVMEEKALSGREIADQIRDSEKGVVFGGCTLPVL